MLFDEYKYAIFLIFLLMICAEALWSRTRQKQVYQGKETSANFAILVGSQVSKLLLTGWTLAVLSFVEPLRLWTVPDTPWFYLLTIVVVDFFYYWQHRTLHQIKFFWVFHEVHHSSPWYNLTTSFRLNWMSPLFTPIFFMPAVLLGFNLKHILGFLMLNLLYQFWLHTQAIPKLGALEGIINTPSAHRVHHGSNPYCIDKNFGGILMIWDRLFGTYISESETVVYGVTTGFQEHNPFNLSSTKGLSKN